MSDKTLDRKTSTPDTLYNHKWGFADTKFELQADGHTTTVTGDRYAISGTTMPGFIPFVEEMLDIKIDPNDVKPELANKPVSEPNLNKAFYAALEKAVPAHKFTLDNLQRLIHSHGQTTVDEVYRVLYSSLDRIVDMVFYLEEEADAEMIIRLAVEHDVVLVPYGGGTSVSCALQLPASEPRMIVSVNTLRLNKILWIDEENFLAGVQA